MRTLALVLMILAVNAGAAASTAVRSALAFEPNLGQTDPRVSFLARARGYTAFLTPQEYVFQPAASTPEVGPPDPRPASAVRLRFVGASAAGKLEGRGELPGKSSYFRGGDPECWLGSVPSFARVVHEGLYPGVRAEVYGKGRNLEYDLVLEPGVRREIEVEFAGASELALNGEGDLLVRIPGGELVQRRPRVYEERGEVRRDRRARYRLTGGLRAAIEVEPGDAEARLVIDPEIEYGTYLGGGADEVVNALLVDPAGNIYIGGSTLSPDFPAVNTLSTARGGWDAYLLKLDPSGQTVLHSLYFGGAADDSLTGVGLGPGGELYVCGWTLSTETDFPLLNAYQSRNAGIQDAFVAKLNPAGDALLFSTFFGGGNSDFATGLGVDASGNVYFVGATGGNSFPVITPVWKPAYSSWWDGFAAALDGAGWPIYSGFLGGNGWDDYAWGVIVDPQGYALVYGQTGAADFPTTPGLPTCGPPGDGFLTKLDPDGANAVFSRCFGGPHVDAIYGAAIDAAGVIHIAGETHGIGVPLKDELRGVIHASPDFFVSRLSGDGRTLLFSTLLGGELGGDAADIANAVGVDAEGNTYVAGISSSVSWVTVNRLDQGDPFTDDAIVAKISADGKRLDYLTYLSGASRDSADRLFVTGSGTAYVAGTTNSTKQELDPLPMANPLQDDNAGGKDLFLIVIGPLLEGSGAALEPSVEVGAPVGFQIQLENKGLAPVTNLVLEDVFPTPALDTSAFDPLAHVATSAPAFPGWAAGKLTLTFSNPIPPGGKESVLITGLTAATAGVHTNEATLIHQTEENLTVAMDFVIGDPGTLPAPVTGLRMAKLATGLRIRWDGTDPLAPRYNLWRQRAGKTLIPVTNAVTARRDKRILATCSAVPQVNPLTTCLQANAIPGAPGVEFYQVRGLNAADLEGD